MWRQINNFKDLLSYCDRVNTYVVSKIDNLVYLENWDILKLKDSKSYV